MEITCDFGLSLNIGLLTCRIGNLGDSREFSDFNLVQPIKVSLMSVNKETDRLNKRWFLQFLFHQK